MSNANFVETLQQLPQVPWNPNNYVGFTQDQIDLIKIGFDHALNKVYYHAQAAIAANEVAQAMRGA